MAAIIILFMFWGLSLGINLVKHGKPRTDDYNFWTTLLALAIEVGLLWWAGLFEVLK